MKNKNYQYTNLGVVNSGDPISGLYTHCGYVSNASFEDFYYISLGTYCGKDKCQSLFDKNLDFLNEPINKDSLFAGGYSDDLYFPSEFVCDFNIDSGVKNIIIE